jgi:membrane-associated protease RseP (regulator of RpoE activity)
VALLSQLATLWLILFVVVGVHVLTMAIAGWVLGAKPSRVRIGYLVPALSFRAAGVQFELMLLPGGGYASFQDSDEGPNRLDALSPSRRIALELSGCAALLVLGLSLGAPILAAVRAPAQLVLGAVSPTEEGARLARVAWSLAGTSLRLAVGLVALKVAAFNLLPIPALNGFSALRAAVSAAVRRPVWHGAGTVAWGFAVLVLMMLGWSVAIGSVVWHALR